MSTDKLHTVKAVLSHLILAGCLFCIFFGQGIHLHELTVHLDSHFDLHLHLHVHESADSPLEEQPAEESPHQHKVNRSVDLMAILNTPVQFNPDLETHGVLLPDSDDAAPSFSYEDTPSLYDLPPPRRSAFLYYLSSYSHRGPPQV